MSVTLEGQDTEIPGDKLLIARLPITVLPWPIRIPSPLPLTKFPITVPVPEIPVPSPNLAMTLRTVLSLMIPLAAMPKELNGPPSRLFNRLCSRCDNPRAGRWRTTDTDQQLPTISDPGSYVLTDNLPLTPALTAAISPPTSSLLTSPVLRSAVTAPEAPEYMRLRVRP